MNTIIITRQEGFIRLAAFSLVTIEDLLIACENHDLSLDSYITGHLMLLDDRAELTYMLNDHYIDVIDQLNETGSFTAQLSILSYNEFQY